MYNITCESVRRGHPDKVCDQISDAILDQVLAIDPQARVAIETMLSKNVVIISGEVSACVPIPNTLYEEAARSVLLDIGYTDVAYGIDGASCGILIFVSEQSYNIAQGVKAAPELGIFLKDLNGQGAGDNGMMYGYACREHTDATIPAPLHYSHQLCKALDESMELFPDIYDLIAPDGKVVVSMNYNDDGTPSYVESVVLCVQTENLCHEEYLMFKELLIQKLVPKVIPSEYLTKSTNYYVNPTGAFVIGGSAADTGLTGRKIIVDTYGGVGRVGGGAFSGKDPSKVDRSAAYMARNVALHLMEAFGLKWVECVFSYAIGKSQPLAVSVDTFGADMDESKLALAVQKAFNLSPYGIEQHLKLREGRDWTYESTASYGHFGRDSYPWEIVDEEICKKLKIAYKE